MPLFDGVTLSEEVRRRGLPIGRALALADQILAGLAAMHAAKVVHRDLQPGNILARPRGAGRQGQGRARRRSSSSISASRTSPASTRATA